MLDAYVWNIFSSEVIQGCLARVAIMLERESRGPMSWEEEWSVMYSKRDYVNFVLEHIIIGGYTIPFDN